MTEIQLTIDWISATSHVQTETKEYTAHPALHDWENWQEVAGANGYTVGGKHQSGAKVYVNYQRRDMGKHIIYSGKVLQRINKMYDVDSFEILKHHIDSGHNITRIDVAVDFVGYGVKVQDFQNAFMQGHVITRLRSASMIRSLTDNGHTFYLGSRKKRKKLVRVYDKASEQGIDGDWIRVELQLMGRPATELAMRAIRDKSITSVLIGAIIGVADFHTIPVWDLMKHDQLAIKLGSISNDKGNTQKWLLEQCLPALAKEIAIDVKFWAQFTLHLNDLLESVHVTVDDIPF